MAGLRFVCIRFLMKRTHCGGCFPKIYLRPSLVGRPQEGAANPPDLACTDSHLFVSAVCEAAINTMVLSKDRPHGMQFEFHLSSTSVSTWVPPRVLVVF